MRFLIFAAGLASACVRYDPTPLGVQYVAQYDGLSGAWTQGKPLRVCDLPAPSLTVFGYGFVPDVRDATAAEPKLLYPGVQLVGPATLLGVASDRFASGASSTTQLSVSFPKVASDGQRWPYGLYSVRVVDFDNHAVELPDAVLLGGGPPVISATPPSTCPGPYSTTVTLRGGPFTGPVNVAVYEYQLTPVAAQLVAADQIDVTVPWSAGSSSGRYELWVYDAGSCPSAIPMQRGCP